MSVVARLREPSVSAWKAAARLRPDALWRRLDRLGRSAGVGPGAIVSFDCDTDLDAEVVEGVHARMSALGFTPWYAVPGQLLEREPEAYRAVRDAGGRFLNHGYLEHAAVDRATRAYRSTLFYEHLDRADVLDDIRRGHEAVRATLAVEPDGFRTPHFGSFQTAEELNWLHEQLAALGYRWSSSTVPRAAYRHGPAFATDGVVEVPVTGCPSRPLDVVDSWSFRFAPDGRGTAAFEGEVAALARMLDDGRALLVNVYADPSQVHDWPGFFDVLAPLGRWATSFDAVVDRITAPTSVS